MTEKDSKKAPRAKTDATLVVRQATLSDIPALQALSAKVYPSGAFTAEMLRGQITNFPQGQFLVEYKGKVVGHCAAFKISGEIALKPHTWKEITGGGYASRHDPEGDYLYGMEVCVDPDYRGIRIGSRLYQRRKKLCQDLNLTGIIFGGRMPGYAKRMEKLNGPEEYLELVKARKLRDQVVFFHLSNDFEPIGILKNYMVSDLESQGYAVHMVWKNPLIAEPPTQEKKKRGRLPQSVRVAAVQFQMRKVTSEEQFQNQLEYFIDIASDYDSDFVVFPELVTLALLSAAPQKMRPEEAIDHLTDYTGRYTKFMQKMAIAYNINIIGGSHPTKMPDGDIHNVSYVFLRDGSTHSQEKLHPTPNERYWWNIKGGDTLQTIQTDCGPIGVLVCYDTEFPETARHLVDQGALMIFVPFCTDERQGYLRVRYCSQAIAVQNQCFVVMAGTVGNLPDVENMDINYAESCVLTPCDFPFARDGIAAIAPPNTETIAFADLQLQNLLTSRQAGSVQNLKDRRFDLYNVQWHSKGKA
ncbi:MAG: GNAT family N-acetyltransferase [Alphaproteobacteria bacterium]|nr:GNAT family N-acetyltransferase [Alphaproteobacteria bacterium]